MKGKGKKKYPRFFVNSYNIEWGGVAYIIVKENQTPQWVLTDGSRGSSHSEKECEKFVRKGCWKEVLASELALII